jgi:hypothetical protein
MPMVLSPTSLRAAHHDVVSSPLESDHVCVRGRRLDWATLIDRRLFEPSIVDTFREQLRTAPPFEHLVVDGWFHPTLLELIYEEFELFDHAGWKEMHNRYEDTRRSVGHAHFGPATQLYFAIINSGWFLDLLSAISSVENLIADPLLYGGGLHETRNGGAFGIHRDFERHVRHGLSNRMVFITYLNKGWDPAWNGGLELWDAQRSSCVRTVQPDFGRSILMKHGVSSYHGHPRPMTAPEHVVRRSVASYYYTNPVAGELGNDGVTSTFLVGDRTKSLKRAARLLMPPIVWSGLKKLMGRVSRP